MKSGQTLGRRARQDAIMSLVARKPCSVQQITHAFSAQSYDVVKLLADMVRSGQVAVKSTDEGLFVVSARAVNP